jgi:prophage regulatory protein
MRILRWNEIHEGTGLSRSTVWRCERQGLFPRRVQLTARTVGWLEDEVKNWLSTRDRVLLRESIGESAERS